jgi:predicted nucleotidyltransferase
VDAAATIMAMPEPEDESPARGRIAMPDNRVGSIAHRLDSALRVNGGYTRHVASTRERLIETLQRTAEALPDVEVLVLFGSHVGESARANSDVDVAIGLSGRSAEIRRAVDVAFARAVHPPVDVSFLDTAPSQLRFEMARSGVLLFERTHGA